MKRLTVIFFAVVLLACGGQDTGTGAGDTPPVSATGGGAPAADIEVEEVEVEEVEVAEDPQIESCLDLVRSAEFQQAIPVCTAALRDNPGNQQVQDALSKAKTEAAKLAAAPGAAADAAQAAATDAATDAAADGAKEAAGGLLNQ